MNTISSIVLKVNKKLSVFNCGTTRCSGIWERKIDRSLFPQGKNNDGMFEKLEGAGTSSKILLTGIVRGYDAPTNLSCERLISLEIQEEEDVNLE